MTYSKYCSIAIAVFLLTIGSVTVQAQRTIGVDWKIPQDSEKAVQQLKQFDELGISIVKLSLPVPPKVWNTINALDLRVYGNLGIKYPLTATFTEPDSALIEVIRKQSSVLLKHEAVKAVGLFSYGDIPKKEFRIATRPFIAELKKAGADSVFATISTSQVIPNDSSVVDFFIQSISATSESFTELSIADKTTIGAYQYHPSVPLQNYITPFKQFVDATAQNSQKAIFINSKWLLSAIERHPSFGTTIQSLSSKKDPLFLMPNEPLPGPQQSPIPIIMLLVIWASVALYYSSSPLYRKSLFRYFNAHKFFIDDIFQRHIRSASPAIILIFQNAILLAAALFACVMSAVTPLGLDALFHHFPVLTIFGKGIFSLTFWIVPLSLLLASLSITWLYISHKRINSFTQIATIYAWPLQLNLLVTTVVVVLYASGGPLWLISLTGITALLVQLLSFIIASFDTARFLPSHTILYLFTTSGLYFMIATALIIWGLLTPELIDAMTLTISL